MKDPRLYRYQVVLFTSTEIIQKRWFAELHWAKRAAKRRAAEAKLGGYSVALKDSSGFVIDYVTA